MKIIPYVMSNGSMSLPDSVMTDIYHSMLKNRLVKSMFPGGRIKNADDFITMMKNSANVVHTVWEDDKVQMLAWLNNFGLNYAFAHFCCWPETWGKTSVELGIETLRYWFGFKNDSQEYILDVILGFTPSNNRLAVRYIQKVGMHIVGEIPGIKFGVDSEGAVLSYIKRSEVK